MTRPGTDAATDRTTVHLTPRERTVLTALAEHDGATVEELAARLWVSRNTVKSQLRSVYRKLGVSTRADAVAWAREAGVCGAGTPAVGVVPGPRSPSHPAG